jgi:peptide/nickel transport system substrate-binding protein
MSPIRDQSRWRTRRELLSRRSLLGAATAGGIGLAAARFSTPALAQEQPATPVAGGSAAIPPVAAAATPTAGALRLPRGITLAGAEARGDERPHRGGSARLVRPGGTLGNFNPSAFAQDPQITLSYLEPLVRPDPVTLRPMPWLATGWAWRDDGRELSLTLRGDVLWHDGSSFTAADAAFSFAVYRDDVDSAVGGFFELVDAVDATADHELRVRFRERDANWLFNVATLPIFSRHQYGDTWDAASPNSRTLSGFDWQAGPPLGTGPWRVASWDAQAVRFAPFDGYRGQKPWLDTLEVAVFGSDQARVAAWNDGETEILWPVRASQLRELDGPEAVLHPAPAASVMFAAFNFANPSQPSGSLWTDIRVRRAASLAIDRQRFADEVFGGFMRWDAVGTVSQPWAHDDSLETPPFSPRAAEALLEEAGWVDYDGDGVREDASGVQLRPVAIMRAQSRPELAAVLARVTRDLAGVGVAITVEGLPDAEFARRWIEPRDFDLIAYAYDQLPGFTDFDLYGTAWDIRTNPNGWNPGGYANAEANAAIAEFLDAVAIDRQTRALARLQRAVDDDLFGLWLGFPDDLILIAKEIAGFQPDMAWQTARTWDLWLSSE